MEKKKIRIFGDSILKGIQLDTKDYRYVVKDNIDIRGICEERGLEEKNISKFGCTVLKADKMIDRILSKDDNFDYMLMDFGGNDCDFNWAEISNNPNKDHLPNCPLSVFTETYKNLITKIRDHGIIPIITSLPPVVSHLYFDWFCRPGLEKDNVLKWLGTVDEIGNFQQGYSKMVKEIAESEKVNFIDIRKPFESIVKLDDFFCLDGIHPNSKGQQLIGSVLREYAWSV